MANAPQPKLELTNEQEKAILQAWNDAPTKRPPSLIDMCAVAWGGSVDPRSREGRAVREFLATRSLKPRLQGYTPKGDLELTTEQKEYIANNLSMKPLALARELFGKNLLSTTQEARTVFSYIKELNPAAALKSNEIAPDGDYTPPHVLSRVIPRINKYVHYGVEAEKLTNAQRKECLALIGYLHSHRFLRQINSYGSVQDRELYESCFVKYTYNKPDLTEEEVDQYVVLSSEAVIAANIQSQIEQLKNLLEDAANKDDPHISMSLVEAMTSARKEYTDSVKRQQMLMGKLVGERSKRLEKRQQETANILSLVQMWKEEDTRRQIIALREKQKEKLKEDIGKLASLDDVKARILGISEEEILHG